MAITTARSRPGDHRDPLSTPQWCIVVVLAAVAGALVTALVMSAPEAVAQDVGRTNGIRGLWVLIPANDQSPLPLLNNKPIPITNADQHARITEAWLANRHRAATLSP